jgi:hypothetical protein
MDEKMMILSSSRHLYIAHYAKKAVFVQKVFLVCEDSVV